MAWQSHWLIGSLLFRAAGDSVPRRKVAGLVAVSQDWCWDRFLALGDPERDWALGVLVGYVSDDDGAPQVLRDLAATRAATAAIEESAS